MTKSDYINLRAHCENIKNICDEFLNQDPIYYDPGNNYEEICYIGGQIDDILLILDEIPDNDQKS
jgi:hypothetical protein